VAADGRRVTARRARAATASAFFLPRTSGTITSFCQAEPLSQTIQPEVGSVPK